MPNRTQSYEKTREKPNLFALFRVKVTSVEPKLRKVYHTGSLLPPQHRSHSLVGKDGVGDGPCVKLYRSLGKVGRIE